jgi:hypothetical protein
LQVQVVSQSTETRVTKYGTITDAILPEDPETKNYSTVQTTKESLEFSAITYGVVNLEFNLPFAGTRFLTIAGKRYFLFMQLNKYSIVIFDEDRNLYQYISSLPKSINKKGLIWCRLYCNKGVRRPHLTCLFCFYRKVWEGKLPNLIPIELELLGTRVDSWNFKGKGWLLKKLIVISELLSEW